MGSKNQNGVIGVSQGSSLMNMEYMSEHIKNHTVIAQSMQYLFYTKITNRSVGMGKTSTVPIVPASYCMVLTPFLIDEKRGDGNHMPLRMHKYHTLDAIDCRHGL